MKTGKASRSKRVAAGLAAAILFAWAAAAPAAGVVSHDAVARYLGTSAARRGLDVERYIGMLDATAKSLIDPSPGLGPDIPLFVIPSQAYPEMYSRDTFWTLSGYGPKDLLASYVKIFSKSARHPDWKPPMLGQIPTIVRKQVFAPKDGRAHDESTMFWVLGAKLSGLSVRTEPYLLAAHSWLRSLVTPRGWASTSHGWIDAWVTGPTPVVSANNQGLLAVTLRALRDMGVAVTPEEIRAADDAYRGLVKQGVVRAYAGSDVIEVSSLLGEALALYLWDESILGEAVVKATIAKFAEVRFPDGALLGYKCLANEDGSYLKEDDFLVVAERDPGNYQNGGSWPLYDALALYAGARHGARSADDPYVTRLVDRLKSEVRYEYSSKEFVCTGGHCGGCTVKTCVCPEGHCGAGAFNKGRSGYGWNLFIKRLLLERGAHGRGR